MTDMHNFISIERHPSDPEKILVAVQTKTPLASVFLRGGEAALRGHIQNPAYSGLNDEADQVLSWATGLAADPNYDPHKIDRTPQEPAAGEGD